MSASSKIIAFALTSIGVIGIGAVSTVQNDKSAVDSSYSTYDTINKTRKANEPIVEVKTETKEVSIPYSTQTIQDSSRAKGTSYVKTEGKNGEKVEIYKVTYSDGKVISRELISSRVVTEPVTKVIVEGTYVEPVLNCPNGTYVNSYGNKVCRPASTNTGGATAICGDGTYSYSRSRRGTCSHHGGVMRWL